MAVRHKNGREYMKGMAKQSVRGDAVAACFWSALTMSASAETLTIGTAAEPKSMDPPLHPLSSDLRSYRHFFNALVEPDDRLPRLEERGVGNACGVSRRLGWLGCKNKKK